MSLVHDDVPPLVLASSSTSRRLLLEKAGLPFTVIPANIDEGACKESMKKMGASIMETALELARLKAHKISLYNQGLVIGCDQMLGCHDRWFDKPKDMIEAYQHLCLLKGQSVVLPTAMVVMDGGIIRWQTCSNVTITMRAYSDAFIKAYLDQAGDGILSAVGACHIENLGQHLIENHSHDVSTIMGLPMMPFLAWLRATGWLIS
jgi:septum formation protein